MSLNSNQINLLKQVIEAAEDGRYCHGNGADWVIVDKSNRDIVVNINHVRESVNKMDSASSKNYLSSTPARKDKNTAESLRNFIK